MTSNFENLLKVNDMYLYLQNFLDIKSLRNLSLSCKTSFYAYKNNKRYLDKKNIKKIFSYFHLSYDHFITPLNNLSDQELSLINKQLNILYNNFYKNEYCSISDFLNYFVERNHELKQSNTLFETLLSFCKFKSNIMRHPNHASLYLNDISNIYEDIYSHKIFSRFLITTSDSQYLLKYSNLKQFEIILKWFRFPAGLLSIVVKDLIYNEPILKNTDKKISKLIDYFLYNFCSFDFTENSGMYFDSIINEIIAHNKVSLLMYILTKRNEYGFELNYQSMLNKCLDSHNLSILKIVFGLIKEFNKENTNKTQLITISPDIIYKIASNGSFKLLEYIISKMLGPHINMSRYISCLCDGISSYYLNLKKDKNKKFDKENIRWLYDWLSEPNKELLNSHLDFIK
jgi:hypothetical protein